MANGKLADYYYFDLNITDTHLTESRFESKATEDSSLLYEVYSPDGIHIWYYRSSLDQDKTIVIKNKTPFFHLHFEFTGSSVYQTDQSTFVYKAYPAGRMNLLFVPEGKLTISIPLSEKLELFNCNLSQEFLIPLLPATHPFLKTLQNIQSAQNLVSILPEFPSNTPAVRQIILDILNCPLERENKQLYLKAKVLELIAIQFNAYEQYQLQQQSGITVKEQEIKKMEHVRVLIQQNPERIYQVADLARLVGTNENYLKKYFKQLFGCSVLQYSMQVRMEKARDLLKQGMSIASVSRLSGYKHISHFTNAFKKYYGNTPGQL